MTGDYVSSFIDSKRGSVAKQLFGLASGYHSVKVRIWDVANNFTEAQTYFYVGSNDSSVESGRVVVFPNPFDNSTNIFFTHNQGFVFTVELKIYNAVGMMVRSMKKDIESLQSGQFVWDARDDEGVPVSQGAYYFVLSYYSPNGSLSTSTGSVRFLRQ